MTTGVSAPPPAVELNVEVANDTVPAPPPETMIVSLTTTMPVDSGSGVSAPAPPVEFDVAVAPEVENAPEPPVWRAVPLAPD